MLKPAFAERRFSRLRACVAVPLAGNYCGDPEDENAMETRTYEGLQRCLRTLEDARTVQ